LEALTGHSGLQGSRKVFEDMLEKGLLEGHLFYFFYLFYI